MNNHNNQPYYQEKVIYSMGLWGLGLENLFMTLLNRRSDSDIVEYPATDTKEILQPRSLVLRHLDCGSCGGCELALLRANNTVWDIQKYNINFESSPRHAQALAVTGPFVLNAQTPAYKTFAAMPIGKIIAIGDCAIDGGIFKNSISLAERPDWFSEPVVTIPGCPPSIPVIQKKLFEASQLVKIKLRRFRK